MSYSDNNINIGGIDYTSVNYSNILLKTNLITICRWCNKNVGSIDWVMLGDCVHFRYSSDALAFRLRFGL